MHLLLLAGALFVVYEIAVTYLPARVPGIVTVLGLLALGVGLDLFVVDRWLEIGAAVALVGLVHARMGTGSEAGTRRR